MQIEQPSNHYDNEKLEKPPVCPEQIPEDLFAYRQWVCWRYIDRGQGRKPDKQPVNSRTFHNAGVNWPNTWSRFETAYQAYIDHRRHGIQGIGFMLTRNDPYVAVDLDSCIQEKDITEAANEIITTLNSYTEISPSGHGLRILLACPDFQTNHRQPQLELYSHARYVTITGRHVAGTPPEITVVSPDQLTALLPQTIAEPQAQHPVLSKSEYPSVAGQALWERIFTHDRLGAQHLRRFQGDLSVDGGDHSLTVIRLLNCLARWTHGDAVQMRQLILLSPLANAKWFEKRGARDWLDYQIADAIAYISGQRRG